MARRRKGRDVSGWVIVDKPAGTGSTDVVGKVRWAFQAKKAGHAGTLDPDATGLLAVGLGEATKLIPLLIDALKCYEFLIRFGTATDTDDASGKVIADSAVRPGNDALRAALARFTGDIEQIPPQVSAVRVEGARAYDLARAGARMDLAPRPLHVASLDLVTREDSDHAALRMVCGKGGYVRSIARDLGRALGTCAHVVTLRRTWSGPFTLDHATTLPRVEDLARSDAIDTLLTPMEHALTGLPRARIASASLPRLKHGNPVEVTYTDADFGDTVWAACRDRVHAIGTYRAGHFHPSRILNRDP